jgi:hypothetical protein
MMAGLPKRAMFIIYLTLNDKENACGFPDEPELQFFCLQGAPNQGVS